MKLIKFVLNPKAFNTASMLRLHLLHFDAGVPYYLNSTVDTSLSMMSGMVCLDGKKGSILIHKDYFTITREG